MSQVVYAFLQWEVQTHVFQPVKVAGNVHYINRTPWQGGIETGSVGWGTICTGLQVAETSGFIPGKRSGRTPRAAPGTRSNLRRRHLS